MYWVLFVGLLDLQQGLIVLKLGLFSIIWHFVGHGGWKVLFGGPAGVMACGVDGTLCGGVTIEWGGGVSWQLWWSKLKKSGNKTSSGEICFNIRTHASPKVGQDQGSGGVSVLCWHAAPVSLNIFYFHIKIGKRIGQKFNNIKCALSLHNTRCKCSMGTSHNIRLKVKFGNNVEISNGQKFM